MIRKLSQNSGFALVLTLVVSALIVALATEMIHQAYVDTSLSRGFRDGQQASILAESGVNGSAKLLQQLLSGKEFTAFSDKWATPLRLDEEVGSLEITVSEESGRINLNTLIQPNMEYEPFTQAALKRLGKRLQVPENIWGALADWMDSDDLPRSGGFESSYYRSLKPAYAARNGKLETLQELSLINGFTPEFIEKLRPFVTIFFDQAGASLSLININTAPKEVLVALDDRIDDRMAERIMEERQLKPFKSTTELSRVSGLDTVAIGLLGKISVKGSLFKITSVARVKDSARTIEAFVRLSGGTPEFLSWQEY